jgi:hypothetical protein
MRDAEGEVLEIPVANFPISPERGTHSIAFSRVFYIDRSDFRLEDSAVCVNHCYSLSLSLSLCLSLSCSFFVSCTHQWKFGRTFID